MFEPLKFYCKCLLRSDISGRRKGEARTASPTCFCSNLINLASKDTYMVFSIKLYERMISSDLERKNRSEHQDYLQKLFSPFLNGSCLKEHGAKVWYISNLCNLPAVY